jgi:hypothetical protein
MTSYYLITEPARRTSLRVDIPRDVHPDEALQAWAAKHDADTLAAWQAECDAGNHDSFASYYADASGDDVQLVEER